MADINFSSTVVIIAKGGGGGGVTQNSIPWDLGVLRNRVVYVVGDSVLTGICLSMVSSAWETFFTTSWCSSHSIGR